MKKVFVHIHHGYCHWKTHQLKHWFGKRVAWRGKYGVIIAQVLDRDMNFQHWI
jgi:hypothetical protein